MWFYYNGVEHLMASFICVQNENFDTQTMARARAQSIKGKGREEKNDRMAPLLAYKHRASWRRDDEIPRSLEEFNAATFTPLYSSMSGDRPRNAAYADALRHLLHPPSLWVDVGTGANATLTRLIAKSVPRVSRILAVESNVEAAGQARNAVGKDMDCGRVTNGVAIVSGLLESSAVVKAIERLRGMVEAGKGRERVIGFIHELFGFTASGEGLIRTWNRAVSRGVIKKGDVSVPTAACTYVAACTLPENHVRNPPWGSIIIDTVDGFALVTAPKLDALGVRQYGIAERLEFRGGHMIPRKVTRRMAFDARPKTGINGLLLWLHVETGAGITFSTVDMRSLHRREDVREYHPKHWAALFIPLTPTKGALSLTVTVDAYEETGARWWPIYTIRTSLETIVLRNIHRPTTNK